MAKKTGTRKSTEKDGSKNNTDSGNNTETPVQAAGKSAVNGRAEKRAPKQSQKVLSEEKEATPPKEKKVVPAKKRPQSKKSDMPEKAETQRKPETGKPPADKTQSKPAAEMTANAQNKSKPNTEPVSITEPEISRLPSKKTRKKSEVSAAKEVSSAENSSASGKKTSAGKIAETAKAANQHAAQADPVVKPERSRAAPSRKRKAHFHQKTEAGLESEPVLKNNSSDTTSPDTNPVAKEIPVLKNQESDSLASAETPVVDKNAPIQSRNAPRRRTRFRKKPVSGNGTAPEVSFHSPPSETHPGVDTVDKIPVSEITPVSLTKPVEKKSAYEATDFVSVQAMGSLSGFAPLGMLLILMDILNGAEEGMVRVNRLAEALSIGKPAMLAQLENLERAGLIRTISSSQRGRHVELLIPNLVTRDKPKEISSEGEQYFPNVLPESAPRNFSLEKLRELRNYLSGHGIQVVYLPDESGLDPRLAQLAGFLGKYLPYVQPFYTRLKATLNEGEEIQFSLLGFQGRDITHTLNFCKMLQDVGFLATFTYRRAPHYKIVARLERTSVAINFLSGGWLEHYIRDKVIAILTTHPSTMEMPYAFMKNPRILLPGDEDFEFDFLLMVGDKVFWIEAKTGEYMDYIGKYSRVAKLLDLNRNNNLLVLVDAPRPDSNISARYGISCCSVDEFAEVFRLALIRELGRSKRR